VSQCASPISIYSPTIKSRSYLLTEKDFSCSPRYLQKRRGVCYTQVVTNDPYFIERWKDHFPARSLAFPSPRSERALSCDRFPLFSSPTSQFSVRRIRRAGRRIGGGIHSSGNKKCMPMRAECEAETVVDQSYCDTLLAINRGRLSGADSRSIKSVFVVTLEMRF